MCWLRLVTSHLVFLPLGIAALFLSNSKELDVFIAILLKSNISNHFEDYLLLLLLPFFINCELFFFIYFSLVLSIVHSASWTLLSVHHTYSYSPRTGVWHLGENEAREKISQTGITLKDDWINHHLPGVIWKTVISLERQSTFFLSNSCVSLYKGPQWQGIGVQAVRPPLSVWCSCHQEALMGDCSLHLQPAALLQSLHWGRVVVTVVFVDSWGWAVIRHRSWVLLMRAWLYKQTMARPCLILELWPSISAAATRPGSQTTPPRWSTHSRRDLLNNTSFSNTCLHFQLRNNRRKPNMLLKPVT